MHIVSGSTYHGIPGKFCWFIRHVYYWEAFLNVVESSCTNKCWVSNCTLAYIGWALAIKLVLEPVHSLIPRPRGEGRGLWENCCFLFIVDPCEIVQWVMMLRSIHRLFPIFPFMITCSHSLMPSCPRLLAENVWWFHLNFLLQRRVWRMHNYCQEYNYQTCSLLAAQLVV